MLPRLFKPGLVVNKTARRIYCFFESENRQKMQSNLKKMNQELEKISKDPRFLTQPPIPYEGIRATLVAKRYSAY